MRPRRLAGVVALTLSTLLHALPSGAGESPTLSAGSRHTCAIDASDALHCWGDDARGQSSPPPLDPPGSGWRAVTASKGGCHTCGLTLRGEARCWGCDDHGETTGVPAVADDRWIALAAGNGFTCGVAAVDRAIRCWGRFLPQIPAPSQPPWYGPWAAVTAGEDWVCALRRSDRTARCRGWSAAGQAVVPERLANVAFDAVSAGFAHTCGVASEDRSVRCWGEDLFGEASAAPNAGGVVLSDADTSSDDAETSVRVDPFPDRWGGVAAGARWTCGVRGAARSLRCWGLTRDYPDEAKAAYDEFGQVTAVAGLASAGACSFEAIAAGKRHACGVLRYSRGDDADDDSGARGEAGDSTTNEDGGAPPGHSPGAIVCWGSDSHGQASPPTGESDGVALPFRAWPSVAEAEDSGAGFLDLRASGAFDASRFTCDRTGVDDELTTASSSDAASRRTRAVAVAAAASAAMVVATAGPRGA